ncbi:MAG: alanine dehydrogenase, partial [Chloroflexi bacterium RBG_13_48_10]
KPQENRVSLVPNNISELQDAGHEIIVETNAGAGAGFSDEEYTSSGARVVGTPKEVYQEADLIIKVKEPVSPEFELLRKGQILFTYLHLGGSESLTRNLLKTSAIGIAYETIEEDGGNLPLLAPMSGVAGRMAPIVGAYFQGKFLGGRGICIAGASGVSHGTIVILGGGVVGLAAAKIAAGLECSVIVLEVNLQRITYLENILPLNVTVLRSNKGNILESVLKADIFIGAVLIPGAKAPVLVPEELVEKMQPGSVIVDVSIDQGGCVATSHPTTHKDPIYIRHGVVHYCVANMPGAYPRTSTQALTNATLPYLLTIANAEQDWKSLVTKHPTIKKGINTFRGHLTCAPVASAFNLPHESLESVL